MFPGDLRYSVYTLQRCYDETYVLFQTPENLQNREDDSKNRSLLVAGRATWCPLSTSVKWKQKKKASKLLDVHEE